MKILLYKLEGSWCFLDVCVKHNNVYWIDFDCLCDKSIFSSSTSESDFDSKIEENLKHIISKQNINILCIIDDKYYYYKTDERQIYPFDSSYGIISVDNTHSLDSLVDLKNTYDEKLYEFNIK
jgi:hypothetical protein